jgi:hypothetical protein
MLEQCRSIFTPGGTGVQLWHLQLCERCRQRDGQAEQLQPLRCPRTQSSEQDKQQDLHPLHAVSAPATGIKRVLKCVTCDLQLVRCINVVLF